MRQKAPNIEDLSADLDIELVSALYRAAGEPDAFEDLLGALRTRYETSDATDGEQLRDAVVRQLNTINTIVADQGPKLSQDPLERAVEEVPTAAVVIDPFGRVVLTNELGQELFAARPGERFDTDLIDPAYRAQFSDFVASARLQGNQRRIIIRLDTGADTTGEDAAEDSGTAVFTPIQLAEAMIVDSSRRDHGCIALRTMEIPWTTSIERQLEEAFGLTQAECAIAREFYELRDTKGVAQRRGTSLATVQTQIKSIFAKTQTTGQAQLLQVLSVLSARAALDKRSRVAAWSNPIGREASFVRSDGLSVAYSWQGAEDGLPVLVLHGHTLGHIFPPEADRAFRTAGLKLHLLSRPGFGHSEFDHAAASADDSARSIVEFCEEMGLVQVPVVTVSSGLTGLSCALERNPAIASSIMHLGYLWFSQLPVSRELPSIQHLIFKMAGRAPRLLSTFSKIAYRNMRRVGVDWYINRVLGDKSHDIAYFRSSQNAGLIRAAAGHLLVQGPDLYARELYEPREPAFELLRQSSLPIMLALPEYDTIHDFEAYAEALSLNDNVRLELLNDSGELYFYKAAETIARLTIQHFAETAPGYERCLESITEPVS